MSPLEIERALQQAAKHPPAQGTAPPAADNPAAG